MKKTVIAMAGALAVLGGTAFAGECELAAEAPAMPDPEAATAEDRAATIGAIKDYQAALAKYRACLTQMVENEELKKKARQAALDAYNASVESETELVAAWQQFNAAYQEANS
ncbi:MAG: hypothetical protein ACE5FO_06390 [Parvularculaceae bacterium]